MEPRLYPARDKLILVEYPADLARHKIVTEFAPAESLPHRAPAEGLPYSAPAGDLPYFTPARRYVGYRHGLPAPARGGARLLPARFFEAVAAGAYREAAAYLTPALRGLVPAGDERAFYDGFFGAFTAVLPDGEQGAYLRRPTENGCEAKRFTAEFAGGKIANWISL